MDITEGAMVDAAVAKLKKIKPGTTVKYNHHKAGLVSGVFKGIKRMGGRPYAHFEHGVGGDVQGSMFVPPHHVVTEATERLEEKLTDHEKSIRKALKQGAVTTPQISSPRVFDRGPYDSSSRNIKKYKPGEHEYGYQGDDKSHRRAYKLLAKGGRGVSAAFDRGRKAAMKESVTNNAAHSPRIVAESGPGVGGALAERTTEFSYHYNKEKSYKRNATSSEDVLKSVASHGHLRRHAKSFTSSKHLAPYPGNVKMGEKRYTAMHVPSDGPADKGREQKHKSKLSDLGYTVHGVVHQSLKGSKAGDMGVDHIASYAVSRKNKTE